MLQLGSAVLNSLSASVSPSRFLGFPSCGTPTPRRLDQNRIAGDVGAVLFDFDGTLTATPGDRAERKYKIRELTDRAPMLEPWLQLLRSAGITLGIISKSSDNTIRAALDSAKLADLFDGPIVAKAVGLEGKAGFIEDMCTNGELTHLGPRGLRRVLLVDDDVNELVRCAERGIQTYAAPEDGGLDDDCFREIFKGMGLQCPPEPKENAEIHRLWTCGLTGESLGLDTEPTTVDYPVGDAPLFQDFYDVQDDAHRLGQGSYGTCRAGIHRKTGQRCAVKFIRKDVAGESYLNNFVENDMFTFLLKMARQERHPNVNRQLDYLMGRKLIYNAQDLLEGNDLSTFLQEQAPITEGMAKHLMHQLFSALQHIHSVSGVGLIHRDIKLENLRFRKPDPGSDLVLIDFGLSCAKLPAQRRAIAGTLLYMAPEIFSHEYDEQVDLWSAGVVLYIILCGHPPWLLPSADTGSKATPSGSKALDAGSKGSRVNPTPYVQDLQSGNAAVVAFEQPAFQAAPPLAAELARGLLELAPGQRMTSTAALSHAWFADEGLAPMTIRRTMSSTSRSERVINVKKEVYTSTHQYTIATPKSGRSGKLRGMWDTDYGVENTQNMTPTTPNTGAPPVASDWSAPSIVVTTPGHAEPMDRSLQQTMSPLGEHGLSRPRTPGDGRTSVRTLVNRPPETILEISPSGRMLEAASSGFQDDESGRQNSSAANEANLHREAPKKHVVSAPVCCGGGVLSLFQARSSGSGRSNKGSGSTFAPESQQSGVRSRPGGAAVRPLELSVV